MSFEAIQKVTQAEQSSRKRLADAAAEAKRIVAEADRMGRQAVAQARAGAEEQVKAMLVQAEERAGQRGEEARAADLASCEALKENARPKLDRAADLIVERIGKS